MFISADVVFSGDGGPSGFKDKEIKITVSGYDEDGYLQEDYCWITKDMLGEVLGGCNEQTKERN